MGEALVLSLEMPTLRHITPARTLDPRRWDDK